MTTDRVRWGILGVAGIATRQVIPAMLQGRYTAIHAVASRDHAKAVAAANQFGIPRAYGSYDELLADQHVDAVYIPLPNQLHVPWSLRAIDAGKHVLCEKPIGLNTAEAVQLVSAAGRHPRLKVMEAFMYRLHPQWQRAKTLVADGAIGPVRAVHTWFSYFNVDPQNVRNIKEWGGGALMDIGCYGISVARFLAGEPRRVSARMDFDPRFGTDRVTSAILDCGDAAGTFTCATQIARRQRVDIGGADGTIEIEIPFNAPIDRPCRIFLQRGQQVEPITFDVCNQYTIQGDAFSVAILRDTDVPTSLDDAVANMRVIDAIVESAARSTWVDVPSC